MNYLRSHFFSIFFSWAAVCSLVTLYAPGWQAVVAMLVFCAVLGFYLLFSYISHFKKFSQLFYAVTTSAVLTATLALIVSVNPDDTTYATWFFNPGISFEKTAPYLIATTLLFAHFSTFVSFYFSAVIYRPILILQMIVIPLMLSMKTGIGLSSVFLQFSLVFFIGIVLVNANERQSAKHQKKPIIPVLALSAALVLVSSFAAPSGSAPYKESFMSLFVGGSEVMSENASQGISQTGTNNISKDINRNKLLFYVDADEPLIFREYVFNVYSDPADTGTWSKGFSSSINLYDTKTLELGTQKAVADEIRAGLAADELFAEAYGKAALPEYTEKTAEIIPQASFSQLIIAPAQTYAISEIAKASQPVFVSDANELVPTALLPEDFGYSLYYYSADGKFSLGEFSSISEYISWLDILAVKLESRGLSAEAVKAAQGEAQAAVAYYSKTRSADIIKDKSKIKELADKLTDGLTSDFDKASAIEVFFHSGEFTYDIDYAFETANSEPSADFLFTSKRGVCHSFATAMVLLCREAGLPARFVSGYVADTLDTETGNFIVKAEKYHAFPEVYISGTGWTAFEPTVSMNAQFMDELVENEPKTDFTQYFIAGGIALAALAIFFLRKQLFILGFRLYSAVHSGSKPLFRLYSHARKKAAKISCISAENLSPKQVADILEKESRQDLSGFINAYERLYYGEKPFEKNEYAKLIKYFV